MNFNLPDETMMIQDTVRRFVDNELIPLEQKFPDRPNSADLPDDVHTKLVGKVEQLGLAAMDAPAEIGGAGLGLLDSCIVTEQVHRSTAGRGVFAMRFAPVLHELGTDEQKKKYTLESNKKYPTPSATKQKALGSVKSEGLKNLLDNL